MSHADLKITLAELFSVDLIRQALRDLLADCSWRLELEEKATPVPKDAPLQVISRSYHLGELEPTFGQFRATVAVGGLESAEHGVLVPRICFATLYFTPELKLMTSDFYSKWV